MTPPVPHLTPAQLDELRAVLEQDIRRLERSMRVTEQNLEPAALDQTTVGRLSRMDTLQGQALSRDLQSRERARLAQIQGALRRMDAGSYGLCDGCGSAIPFERLLVFPEAPHCGACPAG